MIIVVFVYSCELYYTGGYIVIKYIRLAFSWSFLNQFICCHNGGYWLIIRNITTLIRLEDTVKSKSTGEIWSWSLDCPPRKNCTSPKMLKLIRMANCLSVSPYIAQCIVGSMNTNNKYIYGPQIIVQISP